MINPNHPISGAPFAVIDCESTGFAGPDAHIVEIAIVHGCFGSDDVRLAYSTRVRPPISIPDAASKVHGIYDRDVVDAPVWAAVVDEVAAALSGRLAIAYNAPADYLFVAHEQDRLGRPHLPAAWLDQRWLDLLVVRKAMKTRARPGKLVELAEEYGVLLDAHGAAGDALTTALLVRPLLLAGTRALVFRGPEGAQPWQHYRDLGVPEPTSQSVPQTIGDLLHWQRGAALYQEQDFAAYIRRQGGKPPQSYHHILEGVPAPTWEMPSAVSACPDCGAPTLRRIGQGGGLVRVAPDGSAHTCVSR